MAPYFTWAAGQSETLYKKDYINKVRNFRNEMNLVCYSESKKYDFRYIQSLFFRSICTHSFAFLKNCSIHFFISIKNILLRISLSLKRNKDSQKMLRLRLSSNRFHNFVPCSPPCSLPSKLSILNSNDEAFYFFSCPPLTDTSNDRRILRGFYQGFSHMCCRKIDRRTS